MTVDIFPWCQLSGSNCIFLIYSMISSLNMFERTFQGNLGAGAWNQPSHVMNATRSPGVCWGLIGGEGVSAEGAGWSLAALNAWGEQVTLGKFQQRRWRGVPTQHSFFELDREGRMNSAFSRRLCLQYRIERKPFAMLVACPKAFCSRNGLIPSVTCKLFSMWICSKKWAGRSDHSYTRVGWRQKQDETVQ